MAEDYCEHCDLPLSTCIHGMPPPPPPPPPAAKAPRAPRVSTARAAQASRAASAPPRPPSKVSAQTAFRPHIVRILRAEGTLDTEDMFLELEMAMEDELRERDREPTPTGEIRWHSTARKERKAMIDAGLMAEGRGTWELTDAGRKLLD